MAAKQVSFDGAAQDKKKSDQRKKLHDNWPGIDSSKYDLRSVIGSGSYGSVAEAIDLKNDRKVAIKKSENIFAELTDCKRMLREIAILNRIDNKNVVSLLDMYLSPQPRFEDLYLVMELCEYDLKKLFRHPVFLQEVHTHTLFFRMCCGVRYLHSVGIWHRDLKPANILVNLDCSLKICDFGLARAVGDTFAFAGEDPDGDDTMDEPAPVAAALTSHVVTRWYRAPELILICEKYTEAIDNWSLGCILVELLQMEQRHCRKPETRSPLFPGSHCFPLSPDSSESKDAKKKKFRTADDQLNMIFSVIGTPTAKDYDYLQNDDARRYIKEYFPVNKGTGFEDRLPNAPAEVHDLLKKLLAFDFRKRMSLDDVLKHPFMKKPRETDLKAATENGEAWAADGLPDISKSEPIKLACDLHEEPEESELRALFLEECDKIRSKNGSRL